MQGDRLETKHPAPETYHKMRFLLFPTAAFSALLVSAVTAFPAFQNANSPQYAEFLKRAAEIKSGGASAQLFKRDSNISTPDNGFGQRRFTALIDPANFKYNEKEQTVDLTSKEHAYQDPGPNDIRGPCPGLNLVSFSGVQSFHDLSHSFHVSSLPTMATWTVVV